MLHAILPTFLIPVVILFYILVPVTITYFVCKWVTQSLKLKQDQNDLLRELIEKIKS